MSKKTIAYGEGYTAGQSDKGFSHNPYDELTQSDKYSDWREGYSDGLIDRNDEEGSDEDEDEEYDELDY